MILELLQDAFFAAVAAIGFSAISNPPRRAYVYCAVIAAVGHSFRFLLMGTLHWHIVAATTAAAFLIGVLAVLLGPRSKMPPETYLYPALLPMIPGVYAYRSVAALVMCLYHSGEQTFLHYFYLFANNGLTCFFILLGMVVGATVPIFMLPHITFQSTRGEDSKKV